MDKSRAEAQEQALAVISSGAGGVQKRLNANIKYRKSSRLSIFDNLRNFSPAPEVQSKVHKRQQLEKWKEEKFKKKKKPFVVGVPHAPLEFVPPPPPPKPMPSTSGRVTRSQSAKTTKPKEIKESKATH